MLQDHPSKFANWIIPPSIYRCSRRSQNLQAERNQWCEERKSLIAKLQSETANRVAELEAALDHARSEHNQALSDQAEEYKVAFG